MLKSKYTKILSITIGAIICLLLWHTLLVTMPHLRINFSPYSPQQMALTDSRLVVKTFHIWNVDTTLFPEVSLEAAANNGNLRIYEAKAKHVVSECGKVEALVCRAGRSADGDRFVYLARSTGGGNAVEIIETVKSSTYIRMTWDVVETALSAPSAVDERINSLRPVTMDMRALPVQRLGVWGRLRCCNVSFLRDSQGWWLLCLMLSEDPKDSVELGKIVFAPSEE